MDVYPHAGQAKSCKKDSRFPPLWKKRKTTSDENLSILQKQKKKPEIQFQMLKLDTILGVLREITLVAVMLPQRRNSMFRKTIFRYTRSTMIYLQRQPQTSIDVLHEATIDGYWNIDGDKSLSEDFGSVNYQIHQTAVLMPHHPTKVTRTTSPVEPSLIE